MQSIKQISIPKPCHQLWQQMTPANNGRNCQHCSKIVTDFTVMTNKEIMTYLATSSNVCGRIDQHQLIAINHQLQAEKLSFPSRFKNWVVAIGLLGSMSFFKANAQTRLAAEQTTVKLPTKCSEPMIGKIAMSAPTRVIKGIVLDENNHPIPGVIISADHNVGVQTSVTGEFILSISLSVRQFKVSSVGYATQFNVINSDSIYQLKLKRIPQMLGEVIITKRP